MRSIIILFLMLTLQNVFATVSCNGKQVFGNSEQVILLEKNLQINAKLDTGAGMASLSAKNIVIFNQHDQTLIRFELVLPEKTIIFTQPLLGYARILNRKENPENNFYSKYSVRPVIAMPLCMSNHQKTIMVNLVDRSDFRYPLLLGKDALIKFNAIVDVSQQNLTHPGCNFQNTSTRDQI